MRLTKYLVVRTFNGVRGILLLLTFGSLSISLFGQEVRRYIPTQASLVCPNGEYQYYARPSGTIPGTNNECLILDSFSWSVIGGTIISTSGWANATIIWNGTGYMEVSLTTTYRVPFLPPGGPQCVDAGTTMDDIQSITPTIIALTISGSSNSTFYCTDSNITLTGLAGYTSYQWQYSIQTGVWNDFATTSNETYSFGIQDIFGANYTAYLGQGIFFRYTVGDCDPSLTISPTIGAYSFASAPPTVSSSYTSVKPTCADGTDGSVTMAINRNLYPSESVQVISLYTNADALSTPVYFWNPPAGTGSSVTSTTPIIISNVKAGTYYAQVETNYSCGAPNFTTIVVGSGPRTPLSASLAVISNYNGSQLSCAGSSDGSLQVQNLSGGNGTYYYSLDGGVYQTPSNNTFTGVSAGNHTVSVKDGCSTPTTATTNTVNISAPSAVNISSLTPSLCNGSNNGQITASASGGTGTLSYSKDGTTFQGSNVFTNLTPGNYTITVKDQNNCSTTGSVVVPSQVIPGTVSITHPTCTGTSTGSVSISGSSGGTGSLTWSIGGAYQSVSIPFTNVSPGTYSVAVRDANNCTTSAGSITVNQPISASYTSTVASCAAVNDGSITVTSVTGGTGSFQYSLNGGLYQASNVFTNQASGSTYSINVKDGNGCVYTITNATVGLKTPVSGSITQTSFINCFGQTTAAFNVIASGGTPSYVSYGWSNGATGTSVSNVGAGTYTVTITDSKGCQGTASISVSQPAQLTGSTSLSNYNGFNVSCKGGSNGSINLTPSGGTSPYTYSWSTSSTSQNLSGLSAGGYSVTITDSKSCTATMSPILTEPSSNVSVTLQSISNVTCFGANNGLINITGSGGTGALSYTIDGNNYQLSSTFSSLAAGSYTVTARDANSCTASTSTISITTPTALAISSIVKNNPLCNGSSNGSLVIAASGGTSPYTYSKDGTTFSSSGNFSGLTAGSYVLTEKDANGCTISSATQVLSDPALLALSYTTSPQSCAANVDGTISLNSTGGTPSYNFSIDAGATFQSSGNFIALNSGIYQTRVKDNNGCITSGTATVNIQPTLSGNITQSSFINCYGQSTGALSLAVSGGTSPYTYAWSSGPTTQNINSIAAGSYSVAIKDSKNCNASQSITITQPTALAVSYTGSNYNGYGVSCKNSSDGFINVTSSGGTSPYTYSWSNAATTNSISGLTSGTYTATVTDSKSCTANLPVTLTAPTALALNIGSQTNVTCNGGTDGSITLSSSGGAGGISYSINGGTSWQSSSTFSSLNSGSFTLLVKDINNCSNSVATSITEPTAISISIGTIQNAGCGASDGSIQSSASGGTGTLSYLWKNSSNQIVSTSANLTNAPGGVYTLTVTDQSLCSKTTTASISNPNGPGFSVINTTSASCSNSSDAQAAVSITSGPTPYTIAWGDGETGTSAIHLSGGSNTVTVTDGNNCSTTQSFTITSPLAITLSSVQAASPSCPGGSDGSVQVTATGGNSPYTYSWNGNIGGNTLTGLSAGSNSLIVTDTKNCTLAQSINVLDVPTIVISIVNQVNPTCSISSDASVIVQATGGNGTFNYSWNTGTTGSQLNSIASGSYTITATDSKNCLQSKTIDIIAPTEVSSSLTVNAVSCHGGSDGKISVSPSGGTGTFTYSKDNGNTWQSQNSFTSLPAGSYTILSKDQNGCSTSNTSSVTEPTALAINIIKTDPTCGLSNGSAQATVSGGTGAYTYQWQNSLNQNSGSSANLQSAPSDTYTLTATDANLCTANSSVVLAPYSSAQFSVVNIGSTVCSYSSDGSANVQMTSVQSPYAVSWSSGETTTSAIKLVGGQNSVTITDVNNCTVTKTFQVPSPQAINLIFETLINPVCVGGTGSIQVTPTGGAGNFIYSWNGTSGQNNIQNIKAGLYNLLIKDGSGCSFTKTYTLLDPPPFTIDLGVDKTICPNTTTSIGLTLPNATYVWSGPNNFVSTQGIVSVGDAGKYLLTVTNSNGCQATDDLTLTISNNLLKADFLIVSQAHVGDTLVVIDISWPIPDKIQWQLSDSATVIHADNDYALISFSEPGTYTVGVTATLGGCENDSFQKIVIDDKPRETKGGRVSGNPDIISVTAYPNPFVGKTSLKIELTQPGPAILKVYSLITNLLIMSHEFDDDSAYTAELDFNGREAGLYVIVVDSGANTKAVRVVKL